MTVLDVSNNRVTQIKTEASDGYNAIQVAFGSRKASRVSKPEAGHLAKAGVEAGELLKEFRVGADVGPVPSWRHRPCHAVRRARRLDVQGTSIGKGLRRHHQAPQLQFAARVARQQPLAQRPGLHLDGSGSGSRVPRQEDDRPHG